MEFSGQYLTYREYTALGGTLAETPFNLLEFEARKEIDNRTYGRLKTIINQRQEVKLCDNNLISLLKGYAENNARDKGKLSENTDGYSVTYAGVSAELTKTQKSEVKRIIETYLGECKLENGTPYLYRG